MPYKDPARRAEYQKKIQPARNAEAMRQHHVGMKNYEFRHTDMPTEQLFEEMASSARIGVFRLPPDRLAAWVLSRPEPLKTEIVLFGVAAVLKIMRRHPRCASAEALARLIERAGKFSRERFHKDRDASRQFYRIVEMLDAHRVGDKQLGDCTKGDLLRAAADAEAIAGEATMNAQFYRLMAGLLPEHGVTVRQANNRKEVVALLTSTFSEEPGP